MASSLAGYPILDDTFKVNNAAGVKQYSFVVPDGTTDGECKPPASSGVFCLGVALEDGDDDDDILVRRLGIAPVYAQCAINPGAAVAANSASAWASVAVTGDVIVGYADTKATAVGELILVMLNPSGAKVSA